MLAKIFSSAVLGIGAYVVDVEVEIAFGLPSFFTVGLPDVAVEEGRDRVKAAIKNAGLAFLARRITVNPAPAGIEKEGAAFKLPIVVAILAARGVVRPDRLRHCAILGDLSPDGGIRPICNVLPSALEAKAQVLEGLLVRKERRFVSRWTPRSN